jgi:WD40 repeat protein
LWKDTLNFFNAPLGSADGRFVMGGRRSANVNGHLILDAENGKPAEGVNSPPLENGYMAAISDDGRFVAGTTFQNTPGIFVWDTKTGTPTRRMNVTRRTFAPDGRSLVSVDRSIEVWETLSDKKLGGARAEDGPIEPIRHLTWSPDGESLVAWAGHDSDIDLDIYLWDARQGELRFHQPTQIMANTVAASRDPSHWISFEFGVQGSFAVVRMTSRDWRDGKADGTPSTAIRLNGYAPVAAIEVAQASRRARLLTRRYDQKAIQIGDFDWDTGKPSTRTTFDFPSGVAPAMSPDGRFLLGEGRLFEIDRLGDSPALQRVDGRIPDSSICANANGFLVATALKRSPDPKTGKPRGSSDIAVYDRFTGALLRHIVTDEARPFALSPDGRIVADLASQSIRFWDVATGKEVRRYDVTFPYASERSGSCGTALRFSPDGRRLAVGHWDATVVVWESPEPKAVPPRPTPAELDRLWSDLAAPDARTGWAAVYRLADSAAEAVSFIAGRLSPIGKLPEADVRRLLTDLESPTFRIREAAAKRAREWGDPAKVVIDEALRGQPGPDLKQRLKSLAAALDWRNPPTAEDLRRLRALAVLERAATKEARAKIDELAAGLPGARVTREAKLAKQRLPAGDGARKD